MYAIAALALGFCLDLIVGDPHGLMHPVVLIGKLSSAGETLLRRLFPKTPAGDPVVLIGKLISAGETLLRRLFPKTPAGEKAAGGVLWVAVVSLTGLTTWALLKLSYWVSPWLGLALQTVMTAQILATKSLKDESMKVYHALGTGDLEVSRQAVSMIVGRDVSRLDEQGVTRAAVETVAENKGRKYEGLSRLGYGRFGTLPAGGVHDRGPGCIPAG